MKTLSNERKADGRVSSVISGAWDNYIDALREARTMTEQAERFCRVENQADGYHALMGLEAFAYNMVIAIRQNNPRIYSQNSWTVLNGVAQTGPTCLYSHLVLDGRQTYRMRLRFADMKVICMIVYNGMLGQENTQKIADVDFADFEENPDGSIDVIFSAEEHEGNWVQLKPEGDFSYCILRRFYGDWFDDMGDISLEMLDKYRGPVELGPQQMADRINLAADFVRYMASSWNIGLYEQYQALAGGKSNALGYIRGEDSADIGGSGVTSYGFGVIDIEEDEAIIIEVEPPNADFWEFQLGSAWGHSLDFMHHQTDINKYHAAIDEDGIFRAVISINDPGVKNWIDPIGRSNLCLVMRNYREVGRVNPPVLKVVKFSEVVSHLHKSVLKVTPEERRADLEYRRKGYLKLYDSVAQ